MGALVAVMRVITTIRTPVRVGTAATPLSLPVFSFLQLAVSRSIGGSLMLHMAIIADMLLSESLSTLDHSVGK